MGDEIMSLLDAKDRKLNFDVLMHLLKIMIPPFWKVEGMSGEYVKNPSPSQWKVSKKSPR